jgi:hypothetical protein
MVISDEDIAEFQRLYKKRYGHDISKEKAYEQGIKLLRLLKRIYKPMTEKQYASVQDRRAETLPQMLAHFSLHHTDSEV